MKSSFIKYFYIIFIIITLGIIFTSCSGDNNIITPVTNNPQNINQSTPQTQTITKHVADYIYATSGQGSMAENFIILDVPATGQDSFPAQMSCYLQQNYPVDWNKPEIQEIYTQLSDEMVQWKTLLQYNSSAQLFTLYSDSPISVNSDGYFETDVPVQSTDDTVGFEVVLNDKEHFSVNRTSFVDLLTSTGGTDGQLKSCSKTVFALPGGITIFKIFATAMNLKESGLTFSLDNSSIGTITPPFYLKIKGQENFSIAYGVFKAVNNASGMAKTGTIDAKTSNGVSGQNIPMPVEIIHETLSISGKVFTDGSPLIDGHVKSIGPKSFCHLDTEGNYVLPEVFKGTNREVIATWWTDESGKRTKHVEIKYIDSLNGNLTDFNFGVPPTPTPTPSMTSTPTPSSRPFTDQDFYDSRVGEVIWKRYDWIKNFGREQGLEMTLEWLNGNLTDSPPIPKEIVQATRGSDYIRIYFQSGYTVVLYDPIEDPNTLGLPGDENIQSLDSQLSKPDKNTMTEELYSSLINASDSVFSGTLKNKKILILAPYATLNGTGSWAWDKRVYGDLGYYLENVTYGTSKVYDVTRVATIRYIDFEKYTIDADDPNSFLYPTATPLPGGTPTGETVKLHVPVIKLRKTNQNSQNLLRPEHFEHLSDYGIIFIYAHARDDGGFSLSLAYEDDLTDPYSTEMGQWLLDHQGEWEVGYRDTIMNPPPGSPPEVYAEKCLDIKPEVFRRQNYNNALVYLHSCSSWISHKPIFYDDRTRGAEVFLGFEAPPRPEWAPEEAYNFFCYMIFGEANMPSVPNSQIKPKSAYQSFDNCGTFILHITPSWETNVYFPSPIGIKVHKK